jgi:hypothetical protein
MKKINQYFSVAVILLASIIITSGCKKKEDPIVPSFTMTSTTVNLQGGGLGLQFFAKCNNDDVKMTKVIISDPIGSFTETYNLNGTYFVQNEIFALQGTDLAYPKSTGNWSFNFTGNRTADGSSFSVNASLLVSK